MIVSECFKVTVIIEKLSPSWKNFKNYLKYKCKEMGVEDLIYPSLYNLIILVSFINIMYIDYLVYSSCCSYTNHSYK
jgi:hypothetical protein